MAEPSQGQKRPSRRQRERGTVRSTMKVGIGGSVRMIADREHDRLDLYHTLLTVGWLGFFGTVAVAYFAFNLIFAALYYAFPGEIANARPGSFADAFFFSVQTMATIGYGAMYPATIFANLIVTVEVLLGLIGIAVTTGLIFARFSRPTARVLFSNVAVISSYDGAPTFMFRAANRRRNQILEAQVTLSVLRNEVTSEGIRMRRFHDLEVERPRTPIFSLSWTVMHAIDARSPLYRATPESLAAEDAHVIVTLTGLDETFSSTIHARHLYRPQEIAWHSRFVDILGEDEDGMSVIDYRRFHDVEEMPAKPRIEAAS